MAAQPTPPDVVDLQAGSETAWHDAVRLLGPSLRAFVVLRGAADPDGVIGDVFLELSRGIDTVEGGWSGFRTLAFVIARRRVIDGLRASTRRPSDPFDDANVDRAVGGDVEQEALRRLQRGWVLELLDILTPLQRDTLTMRFVAELSVREVAAITGTTETAVKANQRRALAALRRHLSAPQAGTRPRAVKELADVLEGRP